MALIEVEIARPQFVELVRLILSMSPIPFPTLQALGGDRLIADVVWDQVEIGAALAGFSPPPGVVLVRAPVKVRHVSIAELRTDAAATGTESDAVAWLLLSLVPGRLRVDMTRIDVADGAPQTFSPALPIGFNPIDLSGEVTVANSVIVLSDRLATLRFGTAPDDNLLMPPADRLNTEEGSWLIRVSGQVLAEQVLQTLRDGLDPVPGGAVVEDAPQASWTFLSDGGQWGVVASAGIEKEDACPGLFGSVDMSVTVNVNATFTPQDVPGLANDARLRLQVQVSTDASDWDSFRCWAGSGGIGSLFLGAVTHPFIGLGAGIGTLIGVGEVIRLSAGEEISNGGLGGELTKIASDDTSATFAGTVDLPTLPQHTRSASVGPDGLIVVGIISVLRAEHEHTFEPSGVELQGVWRGGFNCNQNRWVSNFLLPSIMIRDEAKIFGEKVATVPVRVFPTSVAEPPNQWRINVLTTTEPIQYVEIEALDETTGSTGKAYIHTSAGIRRFDIPPLPEMPPPPDDIDIAVQRVNCRHFYENWAPWMELFWLPDPPPFNYGYPPLRQWLLTLDRAPAGARFVFHQIRNGEAVGDPIVLTAEEVGEAAIEIVTDASTELRLEHNLGDERVGARLSQRWLVPTRIVDLDQPVVAIARSRDGVTALTRDRLVSLQSAGERAVAFDVPAEGLAVDRGRAIVWGEGGAHQIVGTSLRQLTDEPVIQARRNREGQLTLRTRAETLVVDDHRLVSARSNEPARRNAAPPRPFSVSLARNQVAAAWENRLVFAIPTTAITQSNLAPG